MSRIDELIREMCPDGVEFRPLSELCDIQNGFAFSSELFNTEGRGTPLIRIRDINTGFSGTFFSGVFDPKFLVDQGDIVIGMDGAFQAIRWPHERALLNQRTCRLQNFRPETNPQFLFHALNPVLHKINGATEQSTVKHLSTKQLGQTFFPVPPLEVQEEIVRILDTFTELEAELKAELEARRKQYASALSSALGFEGDDSHAQRPVSALYIAELESSGIIRLGRGQVISKQDLAAKPGTYPVYSSSAAGTGLFGTYGDYMFEDERITWSVDGGGRFFYREPHRYSVTNVSGWLKVLKPEYIRTKFLFYSLTNSWSTKVFDYTKKAHPSVVRREFEVHIPPIEVQDAIVHSLDALSELIDNVSTGLPAEISARRKQYEYYRDKLLTFEELVA